MEFRTLQPDEIELRVGMASQKGFSLLLYKNARVDMQLLDETVGAMNWQRTHEVIDGRLCCTISVWDAEKGQWISKQDVGTESQTEKDKGQFSDAMKRSCVNFGIGRELYSAPFIWISGHVESDSRARSGYKADQRYVSGLRVNVIEYSEKRTITKLSIVDADGQIAYTYGMARPKKEQKPKAEPKPKKITDAHAAEIKTLLEEGNRDVPAFLGYYKIKSVEDMTESQYADAFEKLTR